MSSNSGWICPKCGDVYAPYVQGCLKCNKKDEPNSLEKLHTMYNPRCTKCNFPISDLFTHICVDNLPHPGLKPYSL